MEGERTVAGLQQLQALPLSLKVKMTQQRIRDWVDYYGEGRFLRLKETHPKQYDYIMRPIEEGGLGYKAVIDWINENMGTNIEY